MTSTRRCARAAVRGQRGDGSPVATSIAIMAFFEEAAAMNQQGQIFTARGRPSGERTFDHRPDRGPDLSPAIAPRLAHGRRMFGAEDGYERVVIELDQSRSPPEAQRKPVAENQSNHGPEGLRPAGDRAHRCLRPVDRADHRAHLAPASETIRHHRRCVFGVPAALRCRFRSHVASFRRTR